ncbi:MAG: ABC transporter ATP-binding protein [Nitrospirae bacterium]|nr:ABC transporter ATP-binding protein [Nitrospirota bacterium]
MIEFSNAGKTYGEKWAVKGLTFKIERGEIFALLGPNGAGKTTTIRMMTGLIKPSEGRVLIGGHDIVTDPLSAKRVSGYVPDKSYLYEKLTGREFMVFVSSIYGVGKSDAMKRTDALLTTVGIKEAEHELIENYSHGMRQRLLFASALIHNPEVLIVDEPFVGLDPYGVRMLTALLRELSGRGVTIFLATHSLHIVQELCDKAGIIQRGLLISILERDDFSRERGGLEEQFIRLTS